MKNVHIRPNNIHRNISFTICPISPNDNYCDIYFANIDLTTATSQQK